MEGLAEAITNVLESPSETDSQGVEGANVVDGLFAIARSLDNVARSLDRLGNADAATPMGAIEALGVVLQEAIREGLSDIAEAIRTLED